MQWWGTLSTLEHLCLLYTHFPHTGLQTCFHWTHFCPQNHTPCLTKFKISVLNYGTLLPFKEKSSRIFQHGENVFFLSLIPSNGSITLSEIFQKFHPEADTWNGKFSPNVICLIHAHLPQVCVIKWYTFLFYGLYVQYILLFVWLVKHLSRGRINSRTIIYTYCHTTWEHMNYISHFKYAWVLLSFFISAL